MRCAAGRGRRCGGAGGAAIPRRAGGRGPAAAASGSGPVARSLRYTAARRRRRWPAGPASGPRGPAPVRAAEPGMRAQRLQRGLGRLRLVAADGRLDQLGQRLDHPAAPGVPLARALRGGQRLRVAGQAVVQHRERMLEPGRPARDAADPRVPAQLLDVPGCGALLLAQRGQQARIAAGARFHAGRLPDHLGLIPRRRGAGQLAGIDAVEGAVIQRFGQEAERASTATYDRWLAVLRAVNPRFEFTDPPLRRSLPMALTFAATASRPTAVLTGPAAIAGPPPGVIRLPRPAGAGDMARVSIAGHPLTATAALIWNGDLPRPLQQIPFDTADGLTRPAPASLSPLADQQPAAG